VDLHHPLLASLPAHLCENSARDSVGSRRARIFAIFLALRGDRPRNLEVAQVPSEFSHSLDPKHAFPSWTRYGRSAPESCRRRYGQDAPEPVVAR
jgi:hypothetical protein